jgi:hypothetical protein
MRIGKEGEAIVVEPLEEPVAAPVEEPEPLPQPEPEPAAPAPG